MGMERARSFSSKYKGKKFGRLWAEEFSIDTNAAAGYRTILTVPARSKYQIISVRASRDGSTAELGDVAVTPFQSGVRVPVTEATAGAIQIFNATVDMAHPVILHADDVLEINVTTNESSQTATVKVLYIRWESIVTGKRTPL